MDDIASAAPETDVRGAAGEPEARRITLCGGGAVIDGRFVSLSATARALLEALADAGGRVLSREELGAALPGGDRNAHAVEVAVARLRTAMGDAGLIQTVVKRGYRLTTDDD